MRRAGELQQQQQRRRACPSYSSVKNSHCSRTTWAQGPVMAGASGEGCAEAEEQGVLFILRRRSAGRARGRLSAESLKFRRARQKVATLSLNSEMNEDFVPRRNWSRESDNSHHLIERWREFPG
jgi:hypothetical protein